MRVVQVVLLAFLLAGAGVGCTGAPPRPDLAEDLINELMCPVAGTPQMLAAANTADAVWMRDFIRAKVAEGWSRQRIVDTLVQQYGERILPVPPKEGFNLAVWVTPFATIFGGAG